MTDSQSDINARGSFKGVIARLDPGDPVFAALAIESRGLSGLDTPPSRSMTVSEDHDESVKQHNAPELRLLHVLFLHILDAGKDDPLGAFLGVTEIEFVFG